MADQVAPLYMTHSTPLSTERVLASGRPRISVRGLSSGSSGATRCHSSSVISRYGFMLSPLSEQRQKIASHPCAEYKITPIPQTALFGAAQVSDVSTIRRG